MDTSGLNIDELESVFGELGVTDPATWATSQVEEGIPQLAIVLFLRLARKPIDDLSDVHALRDAIRRAGGRESVEALRRVLDAGVATSDIIQVVRGVLRSYLSEMCFLLDDTAAIRFAGLPRASVLESIHWGLFSVDGEGKPQTQMSGLHEVIGELVDSDH